MTKPDATGEHCAGALRQHRRLFAHVDGVDRGLGGHVALVPNPVNGTGRALPVGLVRRRELGSTGGELQLEQVTRAAEVDQVLSQDRGQ